MAIFIIIFLSTIKRAVYLLPAYPAIALIAGRAMASITSEGVRGAPSRIAAVLRHVAATPWRLAVTLAALDLLLVIPNPSVWKRENSYRGMLDFVEEVGAAVPQTSQLSAAPDLSNPTRVVMAY